MKKIIVFVFISISIFVSCNNFTEKEKQQTNIVLIIADDLGLPQVGCYGSSYYQTPNIDKLAENGVKFTNAYSAAAVCSPTRASIFTGKYPARLHLTDFISGNKDTTYPLIQPDWQKVLPLEELTIAEVLQKNGYKTAIFGKWHLSKSKTPPESLEYNPDKQGFDESFVTYKPATNLPIGDWQIPEIDGHSVDTITNRAIDFIKRNENTPFFLVISHNSIHDPLMEKKASIAKFKELKSSEKEENNPIIAAMIKRLDKSVGKVFSIIEEMDLLDNTIIIFYSDNGARDTYALQTPFRKGKGWLYEGGIRVPMIVHWKGKISSNTEIEQMVSSIDFFPSFIDVTSSNFICDSTIDGINIFPAIISNEKISRQSLYWNYPHYHKGSWMKPACAVRSGDFKLIEWYEQKLIDKKGVYELYNLKDDPGEENNLAELMPEKLNELIGHLNKWKKDINAQEPSINPNYTAKTKKEDN